MVRCEHKTNSFSGTRVVSRHMFTFPVVTALFQLTSLRVLVMSINSATFRCAQFLSDAKM